MLTIGCHLSSVNGFEHMGQGAEKGIDVIAAFLNHPKLKGLPAILETPNELDGYVREIALLRQRER